MFNWDKQSDCMFNYDKTMGVWEIQFVLRVHWQASIRASEFVSYINISDYLVTTSNSFRKCQSQFPLEVPGTRPRASQ